MPRLCASIVLGLAMAMSAGCQNKVTDKDIKYFDTIEVRRLLDERPDSILLIDARAPDDFAEAHLPGARNILLSDMPRDSERDPEIASYKLLVVYGQDPASGLAKALTKRLKDLGYTGIRMYFGGIAEWIASGYDVESSPE